MKSRDFPEPPSGWLADPIMLKWERVASELELTALADVRASAKGWARTIGSMLGVFSIATYLGGAETVRELSIPWNYAAGVSIVVALVLAVMASLLASLAAQPAVRVAESVDGWRLRHEHLKRTKRAILLLGWARPLAVLSLCGLLVGVGLIAFAPIEPTEVRDEKSVGEDGKELAFGEKK